MTVFDSPDPQVRESRWRWAERALGAGASLLLVAAVTGLPRDQSLFLFEFFVLALVARALRVPFDGTTLDLEAAAIFPAVVLAQSWQAGVVLAVVSVLMTRAITRRGRLRWQDVDDAAD